MPEAVLKSPLPASEIVAELAAVTVKSPPVPPLLVLLSTLAPPVCVKLFTFSWMLPAFPVPEVATEIVPPPLIVKVGVVTLTWPALPVLDAVLDRFRSGYPRSTWEYLLRIADAAALTCAARAAHDLRPTGAD